MSLFGKFVIFALWQRIDQKSSILEKLKKDRTFRRKQKSTSTARGWGNSLDSWRCARPPVCNSRDTRLTKLEETAPARLHRLPEKTAQQRSSLAAGAGERARLTRRTSSIRALACTGCQRLPRPRFAHPLGDAARATKKFFFSAGNTQCRLDEKNFLTLKFRNRYPCSKFSFVEFRNLKKVAQWCSRFRKYTVSEISPRSARSHIYTQMDRACHR